MTEDWSAEDCSLKIGAVEAKKINKFEADKGNKKSHIESSQGVIGINHTYQKPTGSFEVVVTNEDLQALNEYAENNEKVVIVYTAPGYTCTVTDAELDTPKVSGDISKAPTVTITFLGRTMTQVFGA